DHLVAGQVVVDLAGVQAALGQQRDRYRNERAQEQQYQRGAHRGQRAPGVAALVDEACQDAPQIGSLTSETNASRSQDTNSFHTPVTSRAPTTISRAPPKTWIARVWRRSQPSPATAPADPNASRTNGMP